MKLIIREIKASRKPRRPGTCYEILKEDSFVASLGKVPFFGVRESINYDGFFEIVDINDNSLILKANANDKVRYEKIIISKNEVNDYVPKMRKDGLSYIKYEFELEE